MSTLKLISSHPDIYDALVDVYYIDLVGKETITEVIDEIDASMQRLEHLLNQRENDEDSVSNGFNLRIAQLAMIKGFIALLCDYKPYRSA